MKNVRSVVSLSHEAKKLFRSNDSVGKILLAMQRFVGGMIGFNRYKYIRWTLKR